MDHTTNHLPARYRTLIRYCREQRVTRAQAGRGLHWAAPQNRPWSSLTRWLTDIALPSQPRTIRLYAQVHDKEQLLTDFPLGESSPASTPVLEHRVLELETRLDLAISQLEQVIHQLAAFVPNAADDDDEEASDLPPWLRKLAFDLLGGLGGLAPQEQVGKE